MDIARLERIFDRTVGQLTFIPPKESVQVGIITDIADWCGSIEVAEEFCCWVKGEYNEWGGPAWFRARWEEFQDVVGLGRQDVSKDNPNREWQSFPPPPPFQCLLCQDKGHGPEPDFVRCTCRHGQELPHEYLALVRESYRVSMRRQPVQRRRAAAPIPFAKPGEVSWGDMQQSNERRDRSERPERKKPLDQEEIDALRDQEMDALRDRQRRRLQASAAAMQECGSQVQ